MLEITTQGLSRDQTTILQAFSRALTREAHVVTQNPDLLWQQLYNRLKWEGEEVKQTLEPELARRSAPGAQPWIKSHTRRRESDSLIRGFALHPFKQCAVVGDTGGMLHVLDLVGIDYRLELTG